MSKKISIPPASRRRLGSSTRNSSSRNSVALVVCIFGFFPSPAIDLIVTHKFRLDTARAGHTTILVGHEKLDDSSLPLFGKEGPGEIFCPRVAPTLQKTTALLRRKSPPHSSKSPLIPLFQRGKRYSPAIRTLRPVSSERNVSHDDAQEEGVYVKSLYFLLGLFERGLLLLFAFL